ncbi:MAG: hypothetical protein AAF641_11570 [Pseudomonadota bacterium]
MREFIVKQKPILFQLCDLGLKSGCHLWIIRFHQPFQQRILLLVQLVDLPFQRRFGLCGLIRALPPCVFEHRQGDAEEFGAGGQAS